jgi:hypothetical protein
VNVPLDPRSASIVLLGLLAAEAMAQCAEARMRIAADLAERIAWEREHFGGSEEDGPQKWDERARLWQPVSCSVSFDSEATPGLVAAPRVTLLAQKDPTTSRAVKFSVCVLGAVRSATVNWNPELPRVYIPKQPADLVEAMTLAGAVVGRVMPHLLSFVDPLRDD